MQAEGVLPGVPDIFIPIPRGIYGGLFIELKYGRNKASDEQLAFIDAIRDQCYRAEICWTFDKATETIETYVQK